MKNCDCTICKREDCLHRGAYRRLPEEEGGLGLCPGCIEEPTGIEAELTDRINALKEWEALAAEAAQEIEAIKDAIKMRMNDLNVEELEVGTHILRWTTVLTNRFDSTAFKKVMPDVYKAYTKQITSRRFSISG